MVELFANNGDLAAASDLGLHCLPVTRLGLTITSKQCLDMRGTGETYSFGAKIPYGTD